MQAPIVFDSSLVDHSYGNTTQMVLQRTMVMSNNSETGNKTYMQNVLIQNVSIPTQPEIREGNPPQHETVSFSNEFIAGRSFGFTKTTSVQNNEVKVCTKN